jgi:NAD(P)H-hydrate repair Nnr-like enzyme with NAD(P)H-hydrate epimerase domain
VIHRPNKTRLAVARWFILSRFELPAEAAIEKIDIMKITKNIGMLLVAVYLIVDGLLGFGLNLGPAIFLLYLVALAAGIFILIGK